MKTLKKVSLELVEVEFIPEILEEGKFYYSKKYNASNHLCPCGCGDKTYLPIKENEWTLSIDDKKRISITPSILRRLGCQSHYIITNGIANLV